MLRAERPPKTPAGTAVRRSNCAHRSHLAVHRTRVTWLFIATASGLAATSMSGECCFLSDHASLLAEDASSDMFTLKGFHEMCISVARPHAENRKLGKILYGILAEEQNINAFHSCFQGLRSLLRACECVCAVVPREIMGAWPCIFFSVALIFWGNYYVALLLLCMFGMAT